MSLTFTAEFPCPVGQVRVEVDGGCIVSLSCEDGAREVDQERVERAVMAMLNGIPARVNCPECAGWRCEHCGRRGTIPNPIFAARDGDGSPEPQQQATPPEVGPAPPPEGASRESGFVPCCDRVGQANGYGDTFECPIRCDCHESTEACCG